MSKISGFDFLAFLGSGSSKTVIGGSRTVTFSDKQQVIDTTTRDGQSNVLGFPAYTLAVDGLSDFVASGGTNTTTLISLYKAQAIVNWQFGLNTNRTFPQTLLTSAKYLSGSGRITDLKIGSSYSGAVDYSCTIDGIGAWNIT